MQRALAAALIVQEIGLGFFRTFFLTFAPDFVRGKFGTTWIYVVGPLLGAATAVGFEWILKGKPTVAGGIAAKGID